MPAIKLMPGSGHIPCSEQKRTLLTVNDTKVPSKEHMTTSEQKSPLFIVNDKKHLSRRICLSLIRGEHHCLKMIQIWLLTRRCLPRSRIGKNWLPTINHKNFLHILVLVNILMSIMLLNLYEFRIYTINIQNNEGIIAKEKNELKIEK